MFGKSTLASGKEAIDKVEKLKNSEGLKNAVEVLTPKSVEKALDLKHTSSETYLGKRELAAETNEQAKGKPWWKRGITAITAGGFALLIGRSKESKEIADATGDVAGEAVDILTDETKLKETNDTFQTAIEAEREVKKVNKDVNEKWGFEEEKTDKDWFKELEKKEKKYKKYGTMDAVKEAWSQTEYEVNSKTGEKKKRNFFFRLFAFIPAITKTWSSWRTFEKLKKSGVIEKAKKGKEYKDEAEKKVDEAEAKLNKGLDAKKEAFSSVFEENPGALQISKNYFKQLSSLTKNADKYTSAERADLIRKYARDAATKGTKQYGAEFSKMKGFQKRLPGVSIKQRGGFMLVEIVGKSLGAALREGSEEGGWTRATDVFKEELTDVDNWKDACPIWGTIRSAKRLGHDDAVPQWSKWLDFGLSAGMDVASIVAIIGSLGTATPAILAARSAGGAAARSGVRKLGMRQLMKQGLKGGESLAAKELGKESRKAFSKQMVRTAGGKWGVRVNLMMTTVGEFFGEDIDESVSEAKLQAQEALLTEEQNRLQKLIKAAKTGGELPPAEDMRVDKEKAPNSGIFSEPKEEKKKRETIKSKTGAAYKSTPKKLNIKTKAKHKAIEILTKNAS